MRNFTPISVKDSEWLTRFLSQMSTDNQRRKHTNTYCQYLRQVTNASY